MKQKIVSAVVYAITVFDIANFLDSLYGAGPVTHNLGLIRSAIAGAILFVVASISSLFSLRVGTVCALAACILSWPFFSGELYAILRVWRSLFSVVHYSYWGARLASVFMVIFSSIHTIAGLRALVAAPGAALSGPVKKKNL
jgi:hypothetical protein